MDTQKLIVKRIRIRILIQLKRSESKYNISFPCSSLVNVDASLVDKRRSTTLSPAKNRLLPATGVFLLLCSSHRRKILWAQDSADWNSDDDLDLQIDNYQSSPPSSPPAAVPSSDELFATLVDMGFSPENIARAIDEHGPNADTVVIIDAISKYTVNCEASSSKSKTIDHFLAMGFEEEKVIKAIHEHGN
ncbi:hypothetical protein IGI04_041444 [Brassica rapa subsp. trilocularis]|uniref:UBA domain-containing protein n=1 Tax=Brassica rapa subsp. trilocularis TaxID=1813537 RepID=A0ABQ7KRC4_BRACM|nr:hypothetical protein IGI04_041444 [Brassica rapa subsp. trilocularis]